MPAIRDGLVERFGGRAPRLSNGDRIISEGAAWIAHDKLRLGLAKPIELLQSDDTYAAVVPVPFELPMENERKPAAKNLYRCVDPREGRASFSFARPSRPHPRDARSDRQAYTTLHLAIDETAAPLMERLELDLAIDHDYIAHVDLRSTMRNDHLRAEIFDLEFTLKFPAPIDKLADILKTDGVDTKPIGDASSVTLPREVGKIRLRSNIAASDSWRYVPGDLVIKYHPSWFDSRSQDYSAWQYRECVYYKDCPYCHRSRYEFRTAGCDSPRCLWAQVRPVGETDGRDLLSP